jgi:glycosyltransferase involved in cell wall biosynthesis
VLCIGERITISVFRFESSSRFGGAFVPLGARGIPNIQVIRAINGRGWLYSSRSPLALGLRSTYRMLHRLAARSTAITVFEHHEDKQFFERHRMLGRGGGVVNRGAGIDVPGFERAASSGPLPGQLRNELGLVDSKVVITVTRIIRQKGIPTLLEAAALVRCPLFACRPSSERRAIGRAAGRDRPPRALIRRTCQYI